MRVSTKLLLMGVGLLTIWILFARFNQQSDSPPKESSSATCPRSRTESEVPQDSKNLNSSPGIMVRGTVIDEITDDRIPNAGVQLRSIPTAATESQVQATSAADGTYSLMAPPGQYIITWYHPRRDQVPLGSVALTVEAGEVLKDLIAPLCSLVTAEGIVMDVVTGIPVADARIIIAQTRYDERAQRPFIRSRAERYTGASTHSDADGNFKVTCRLIEGQYAVDASHSDHKPFLGDLNGCTFRVTDEPSQRVRFTLRMVKAGGFQVGSRLVSKEGLPIVGARISIRDGAFIGQAVSDTNGEFRIASDSLDNEVTVRHQDFRTLRTRLRADVHLNLPMDLKSLQVNVKGIDSAGSAVALPPFKVAEADSKGELNPYFTVLPSADGTASFRVDPDIGYCLLFKESESGDRPVITAPEDVRVKKGILYHFVNPVTPVMVRLPRH